MYFKLKLKIKFWYFKKYVGTRNTSIVVDQSNGKYISILGIETTNIQMYEINTFCEIWNVIKIIPIEYFL